MAADEAPTAMHDDEQLFEALFDPSDEPTALDMSLAAMELQATALDMSLAATELDASTAATAFDPPTVAATALDPLTAAFVLDATATATAAATALDPPSTTAGATVAEAAPTALDPTADGGEKAAAAECGDMDEEDDERLFEGLDVEEAAADEAGDMDEEDDERLLKEVEAALFSGSEDEADVCSSFLKGAIDRLAPKGAEALPTDASSSSQSKAAKKGDAGKKAPAPPKVPPPPPPPPPNVSDNGFDETRYMKDQNDQLLHKWKIDYAARAGGGRAMCKDTDCLERHEQGGVKFIEKGHLRIGRRVLMKGHGSDDEGHIAVMYYHARCMFNVFLRSRKDTRVIKSAEDLEGFEHLDEEDQSMMRRFIVSNEDVRTWKGVSKPGKRNLETPEKGEGGPRNSAGGDGGLLGESMSAKRRRLETAKITVRKGDRIWTFCRVRPPPSADGRAPVEFAVKSPKPELGLIVEEEKDGHVIIQFEKAEDEKERLAMYAASEEGEDQGLVAVPTHVRGEEAAHSHLMDPVQPNAPEALQLRQAGVVSWLRVLGHCLWPRKLQEDLGRRAVSRGIGCTLIDQQQRQ
eukprot:CAMPEP_0203963846 /NCGR_PEP_ID=MMETSP0359-20131031/93714_1 /ASSEMBLY_ACC=CAM_ASM_000338 /TAXON_ID=268821 /ORGANISM="Scrippsiella Hangoei, Strain SHTV-5" /LENGTH=577 /DNA_ID=CAMNT_0050899925 /DNA_START=50 /DNA_END=1779 /DNA_ORIENTATION=+